MRHRSVSTKRLVLSAGSSAVAMRLLLRASRPGRPVRRVYAGDAGAGRRFAGRPSAADETRPPGGAVSPPPAPAVSLALHADAGGLHGAAVRADQPPVRGVVAPLARAREGIVDAV